MRYLALLALAGCAYAPAPPLPALERSPVPTSAVLPYTDGWTLCGAVVVGEHELLTAAHCVRDLPAGVVVRADGSTLPVLEVVRFGDDGARLRVAGELPAAAKVGSGPAAWFAGYGCRSDDAWWQLRLSVRPATAGLDVCRGDSGGGAFNARGELVAVVTGVEVERRAR